VQASPSIDLVQSSNSGIAMNISGIGDSIIVNWGDGTSTTYAGGSVLAAQHLYSTPGLYTICIQLYGLCGITSTCVKNYPLSIDHLEKEDFMLYPNPTRDEIWIEKPNDEQVNYELYNSIGMRVQSGNLYGRKSNLSLYNLPIGVYQLKLIGKNNYVIYQLLKNE
jgi:hypothetical protein